MRATTTFRGWLAFAVVAVLGFAGGAQAAPITYVFQSGQIRVEASSGAQTLGISDVSTLDGFSVTIDTDSGELTSMLLYSGGPVEFSLDPTYAGYDFMSLTDIMLSGSGDLSLIASGPPDLYSYTVNPLEFEATLDASGPSVADLIGMAIASTTDGSGFIVLDEANSSLSMQGVTIGEITLGDESETLVLKADFVFAGVIPEPNGAWLMAVGVLIVALAGMGRQVFAR